MAHKKKLVDSHVRIDINLGWFSSRDPEEHAKRLDSAARDVKEFIRDHRSMDINDVYVVREYAWVCEHCGWTTQSEVAPYHPECCDDAIRDWATPTELVKLGIIEEDNYDR
jgi:rubrerythrin